MHSNTVTKGADMFGEADGFYYHNAVAHASQHCSCSLATCTVHTYIDTWKLRGAVCAKLSNAGNTYVPLQ